MLLGGRYDDFNANYRSLNSASGAVVNYERTDRVFSYRSGLMYQPDDYSSYYLSHGTAFNPSGDLYSIEALGNNNAGASTTDPEKSINTELGGKWELFKGRLSAAAALFRTTKLNERNTDQSNTSVVILSGKRHTDGIDLSLSGKITDNWEVFTGATFMHAVIDRHVNSNAEGLTPPLSPKATGNLWTSYRFNQNWRAGVGGDFTSRRTAYSVPNNGTPANVKRVPGYARFDAMIEWADKQYSVKLNILNLLDKEYYDSIYNNGGWGTPGIDRQFQLTAGYKF